ncbi:hypothetical protein [Goodfellowiella coeruleoviolacea]|uniref:Uncharacterized protein n=1 Tax=Goodfellowiella coeruleoviolacea TaxID=334858 RepID=A0AAE3GJI4_9PSEU|nr:hypothetical protein [Goodfellowiella coeruleoviolacea]MCP2169345.1 hypothetical protein [Goodfellowiella coeruleoviolacea]
MTARTRLRSAAELAFPGFVVGLLAGAAGGALTAFVAGSAGWALLATLALGVPLGLLGGGYGLVLATGRVRLGVFAPAALYWLVGFPLARLVHEVVTRLAVTGRVALPDDLLGFLTYQAVISAGYAIGFLWLHERIAPHWFARVGGHNPAAQRLVTRYVAHARSVRAARQRARSRRPGSRRRPNRPGQPDWSD